MKALFLAVFAVVLAFVAADNWAVLVAGSNGYYNYRHQSDVCHSYQILKDNGIPDDHIIVMMYDDIAYNSQNPKKGSMINEPGGPNVYPGVPKDYVGNDVTPDNFLKILKNTDMGEHKKTLKTGPNDNVFIYFTDHGGPGLIAFPNDKLLYVKDLIATLKYMHENKLYKKLVFYMEACESGSMFNGVLPDDWDIYATTASNPYQSSYACYYDQTYRAYLADCYSINWMNHTETHDIHTTTLDEQFKAVKQQTSQSPCCLYGDVKMGPMVLAQFQGTQNGNKKPKRKPAVKAPRQPLDTRDIKLNYLQRLVAETNDMKERETKIAELSAYQRHIDAMDVAWSAFKGIMNLKSVPAANDDQCYGRSVAVDCMKEVGTFAQQLGLVSEYSLKHMKLLDDACHVASVPQIQDALKKVAKHF